MNIGDKVTPKSGALWLSTAPTDGSYNQKRENALVFRGVGEVINKVSCEIDYDEWDRLQVEQTGDPAYGDNLGVVTYHSVLIRTAAGEGWAGEGAVVHTG